MTLIVDLYFPLVMDPKVVLLNPQCYKKFVQMQLLEILAWVFHPIYSSIILKPLKKLCKFLELITSVPLLRHAFMNLGAMLPRGACALNHRMKQMKDFEAELEGYWHPPHFLEMPVTIKTW
jgi:hypothetical protein